MCAAIRTALATLPRVMSGVIPPDAVSRSRRVGLLLVVGAAILLAGLACSSDADEPAAARGPTAFTEEEFRRELVNARPPSPMNAALGLDRLGSGGMLRVGQLLEEETAKCMRNKGWEYEPQLLLDDVGVAWLPAMTRDEFARTHGFGSKLDPITTSGGLISTGEEELEYVNTLTLAESEAYYDALDGPVGVTEPAGCRGEARQTAMGGHFGAVDAIFRQAQEEVVSHPEYQAANEAYADCTSAQGLPWLDLPSAAMLIGYGESLHHDLTPAQEIDAALVDLECRYPWEIIARQIRHETQTPLVEANRDMLAEVRELISG